MILNLFKKDLLFSPCVCLKFLLSSWLILECSLPPSGPGPRKHLVEHHPSLSNSSEDNEKRIFMCGAPPEGRHAFRLVIPATALDISLYRCANRASEKWLDISQVTWQVLGRELGGKSWSVWFESPHFSHHRHGVQPFYLNTVFLFLFFYVPLWATHMFWGFLLIFIFSNYRFFH